MSSPESTEPPTGPAAPATSAADAAKRRRTIRFFAVIAVAGVVAVGAILVAVTLNQPSGTKPQQAATISAGPIVSSANPLVGGNSSLPPLAIVLPRTDAESNMSASNQVIALRGLLATKASSTVYLDLGQAYMALGDQASAQAAFTAAAALAPAAAEPLVGLAMTEGMSGTAGLETADAQLRTIEARFPTNQVVAFNLGWLAVYRKDVATVREAWARTIALGVKTPLGAAAYVLLNEVNKKTTK